MATYKDDLDIIKAAEKDSSKLSLNAITELDNKGLLGMYGGGGSEEDNPVKLADVKFIGFEDNTLGLINLTDLFVSSSYKNGIPVYYPENTEDDDVVQDDTTVLPFSINARAWNRLESDSGMRLIAPFKIELQMARSYIVSGVQGEAEIVGDDVSRYLHITGNCMIILSVNESPK